MKFKHVVLLGGLMMLSACISTGQKYPGFSLADPVLQRDASPMVIAAASQAVKGNCPNYNILHTAVAKQPNRFYNVNNGAWIEKWLVDACGQPIYTYVTFAPDVNGGGTTFTVSLKR